MKSFLIRLSLVCSTLGVVKTEVNAATLVTSPAELLTANLFIGFEVFPDGQPVPPNSGTLRDQWRTYGLLIADSSPEDGASAFGGVGGFPSVPPHSGSNAISDSDIAGGGFVEFRFVIPNTNNFGVVHEVGLWVQNGDRNILEPGFPLIPSTVTFFDAGGAVLGAVTTDTQVTDQFVGIQAPEGVALVRISDDGGFMVDDLRFSPVPEPAGLAIMLSASLALLAARRKGPAK